MAPCRSPCRYTQVIVHARPRDPDHVTSGRLRERMELGAFIGSYQGSRLNCFNNEGQRPALMKEI
jgi:hypothetical protein